MMRITKQQDGETITLKIEGCLAGEWVSEMERCWDEVRSDARSFVIRIDLTEVTSVDAAGGNLLAAMFRSGVTPTGTNVMTKAVIEQLTGKAAINLPDKPKPHDEQRTIRE